MRSRIVVVVSVLIAVSSASQVAKAADGQAPSRLHLRPQHGVPTAYEGAGVYGIRPRSIIVDSADGGELRVHWSRWSSTVASGAGKAYPDHGSFAITVTLRHVIRGTFTRLSIISDLSGRKHVDSMALAYQTSYPSAVSWLDVSWIRNPQSGNSFWPP